MRQDWPIFVLSLKGDEARRRPLVGQLQEAGLAFEVVEGVDGRQGLPSWCESLVDRAHAARLLGRAMSEGELACALSHRAIYQRILDQGLPGAIVLEDDGLLLDQFVPFIRSRDYQRVPMVLMYYNFGRASRLRRIPVAAGATLRRVSNKATGAMAYSVSAETAKRLLAVTTPVRFQTDWLCDLHALRAWFLVPRAVSQREDNEATSHLKADRSRLRELNGGRRAERRGYASFGAWLRERLSVRVDRAKGGR